MTTLLAEGNVRTTTPCISTQAMECAMKVTETVKKSTQSFKWGAFTAVLFAIVVYDMSYVCPTYTAWVIFAEGAAAVILGISTLFHIGHYIWSTCSLEQVSLTSEQMRLMGIKETDPHFKVSPSPESSSPKPSMDVSDVLSITPMNLSATSWRSASFMSSPRSDSVSPNYSMSATSWEYIPTTPGSSGFIHNDSTKASPGLIPKVPPTPSIFDQSNFSNASSVSFIEDETSLAQYLREYDAYEQSIGASIELSPSAPGTFWRDSISRVRTDVMPVQSYQLAYPTPAPKSGSPSLVEGGSPTLLQYKSLDMWRRLGIKAISLTQWNSNLRMWISQTVLERLVREMDAVDEALQRHGLTDMKIGCVGLERLKKTAQVAQVAQNIPTLPRLVPFLELTSNQEYLVARIRELAKGGCMSDFRWSSGGSLHGKQWEEHLPTDSALVMYLLATYLDTQLPPQPQNPDRRAFTSEYLVKFPDKVPAGKKTPLIQEVQVNPPYYVFIAGGEKMEVDKGRNNFFHTFLLFIHHMKTKEHGMLGRINLGPSGINLLWVIDS